MTVQGRVNNGVVVLSRGFSLPEGTLVNVTPIEEAAITPPGNRDQLGPNSVTDEQRDALLGLIGMWKVEHPPNDEEVKRIIEEHRMKKYG